MSGIDLEDLESLVITDVNISINAKPRGAVELPPVPEPPEPEKPPVEPPPEPPADEARLDVTECMVSRKGGLRSAIDALGLDDGTTLNLIFPHGEEWPFRVEMHASNALRMKLWGNETTVGGPKAIARTGREDRGIVVCGPTILSAEVNDLIVAKPPSYSDRCISASGGENDLLEYLVVRACVMECNGHGIQGDVPMLEVSDTTISNGGQGRDDGKYHCIYHNNGDTIRITNLIANSVNGHCIKFASHLAEFRGLTLAEGTGNTGGLFHSMYATGTELYEDIVGVQQASDGNPMLIDWGSAKTLGQCVVTMQNVELTDETGEEASELLKFHDSDLNRVEPEEIGVTLDDQGGNTINGNPLAGYWVR